MYNGRSAERRGAILKVTAIIPVFWESRKKDLPKIVAALQGGTLVPDILILDQSRGVTEYPDRVSVIKSLVNMGPVGRLAIAAGIDTDLILSHDDDLVVGKDTVRYMVEKAWDLDSVVAFEGKMFHASLEYRKAVHVSKVIEPRAVDTLVGRLMCYPQKYASTALTLAVPGHDMDDDILLGAVTPNYVIPQAKDTMFESLDEKEGLYHDWEAHCRRRTEIAQRLYLRGAKTENVS